MGGGIIYKTTTERGKKMKKPRKDLFNEVKIKMVMKIYGLSRSEAVERIARCREETAHNGNDGKSGGFGVKAGSIAPDDEEEFMSAEEFFGD